MKIRVALTCLTHGLTIWFSINLAAPLTVTAFFKKLIQTYFLVARFQGFVFLCQCDFTLDCVIEVPDPVGGEKHDPLIIFKFAEEDRYPNVLMAGDQTRLHKDIRLARGFGGPGVSM